MKSALRALAISVGFMLAMLAGCVVIGPVFSLGQ